MDTTKIWFDDERIFLRTKEGKLQSMPLAWFPRLQRASSEQRNNFTLSPYGIHWEELDEDLSFEGFFKFKKEVVS